MSVVLENTISRPFSTNGVKPRLITVAEYDRMIEAGIYTENDRIELLNGEIIELMPKGPKHVYFNEKIADILREKLGKTADVRSQNPIILDDFSEPEPDIVLAIPPRENYLETHPTSSDILLIMEISDTTLTYDREAKAKAYSRNGIQQYIVLNVQDNSLEDYRNPAADGYQSKQTYRNSDKFNLTAFPDIEINVDELF